MILLPSNTAAIGKPVRLFDREWNEIADCVYCDTQTGECVQQVRDENGDYEMVRGGGARKVKRIYKAPIIVCPTVWKGKPRLIPRGIGNGRI